MGFIRHSSILPYIFWFNSLTVLELTFAPHRASGSSFFDTEFGQDKILYLAKLVISHSNHHLDKFIKQHHIV